MQNGFIQGDLAFLLMTGSIRILTKIGCGP